MEPSHERQDLPLSRRELAERMPAAGQQLGDHLRVQGAAAGRDPAQRVEELGHIGDPVLQQVAHALRAARDELGGVPLLHPLGQHQDAHGRPAVTDHERGPQSLVGERRRHPHVHHAGIRLAPGDGPQESLGVADGGDDLVPLVGQQPGEPFAEQDGILRDRDAQ